MLHEDEIKFIETKIKTLISSIEGTYYNEYLQYESSYDAEEYPGFTKYWITESIKDLYLLIKFYFEVKGVLNFLNEFKLQFDNIIFNPSSDLLKSEVTHPDLEQSLNYINSFKRVLSPFLFFDNKSERKIEAKKVITILKNTDYILKKLNCKISNEADIYNQIKWVIGLYFPKCRLVQKASFIQEFKTYNPDILIPELRIAIEYKYLKTKRDNIDKYIDEIKIDSANYIGDYRFDTFIAVLYIKDTSIATPEHIMVSWEQKKFPKNWELVIAMGSK